MHQNSSNYDDLVAISTSHINNIIHFCFEHTEEHAAMVVFDQRCKLSKILFEAYQRNLPHAQFIDFDAVTPEFILASFAPLKPADLVVLIQSTNFRLEAFRLRVELFKRDIKVIEHPHLERMNDEQVTYYVDSLAYDLQYYRGVGPALKERIDQAQRGVVNSGEGAQLFFDSPFESARLNIGDYTGMKNIGGQFPIGEVFTESRDLEAVHGRVRIFVFGDTKFTVNKPEQPITLIVHKGRVTEVENSTAEFDLVLKQIRDEEGEVWLRELGFGMNRAFSVDRLVDDIGTYERMCGIHLSLGAKHGQYNKPQIKRALTRYHVDVFAATEAVLLDDVVVYQDGAWVV